MKYVLIVSILITVYSFSQCSRLLMFGEEAGALRTLYCRLGFFHIFPRHFSPLDVVIHLLLWVAIGVGFFALYRRYLKGRLF